MNYSSLLCCRACPRSYLTKPCKEAEALGPNKGTRKDPSDLTHDESKFSFLALLSPRSTLCRHFTLTKNSYQGIKVLASLSPGSHDLHGAYTHLTMYANT